MCFWRCDCARISFYNDLKPATEALGLCMTLVYATLHKLQCRPWSPEHQFMYCVFQLSELQERARASVLAKSSVWDLNWEHHRHSAAKSHFSTKSDNFARVFLRYHCAYISFYTEVSTLARNHPLQPKRYPEKKERDPLYGRSATPEFMQPAIYIYIMWFSVPKSICFDMFIIF